MSSNDGTMSLDPVSLSSDVGTWVAAFFAIVALIGIVGPWLAIKATTSDKNRALNAVYDKDNVYVKFNGIPLGSRLRIFRRIRVPDLAPNYESNDSEIIALLPSADDLPEMRRDHVITSSNESIKFVPPSYSNLNKGWARFCQVLESYSAAEEARAKFPIQHSGGKLEIVGRSTALVVSRNWILILGLLGRYSNHHEQRTYDPTGIQRALHGERHSVHGADLDSELEASFDIDAETDKGTAALAKETRTKVSGITGEFESLGQKSGPRLALSTVRFSPHNGREILGLAYGAGTGTGGGGPNNTGLVTSSIAKQFWLASGIVPTNLRDTVVSVEDPIHDATDINKDLLADSAVLDSSIRYFRLQGIETVPANLKNSMISLGIGTTHIERFQEDEALREPPRTKIRRWRPRSRYDDGFRLESDERPPSANTAEWVQLTDDDTRKLPYDRQTEFEYMRLYRKDVDTVVFSFLSLGWDSCGHLVWGNDCFFWRCLLSRAAAFLDSGSSTAEVIRNHLIVHLLDGVAPPVINWKISGVSSEPSATFNAMKTRHLVEFANMMLECLSSQLIKDLRAVLGTLLVVDVAFKGYILELLHDRLLSDEYTEPTNPSGSGNEEEDEANEEVEDDTSDTKSDSHSSHRSLPVTSGSGEGMDREDSRRDVGESLPRKPASRGRLSPDYLEDDDEDLQPKFLTHPHFQYDMTQRTLANRPGPADHNDDATVDLIKWHCSTRAPFTNNPATRVVEIPAKDMVRIALWTAARAELWLSSLNSRPLLSFCNQLSRDVYML